MTLTPQEIQAALTADAPHDSPQWGFVDRTTGKQRL